jgi:hypothetical protein
MKRESRAPLIVALVLLLLPVLYLGSYLALVVPSGIVIGTIKVDYEPQLVISHYRTGGDIGATIFYPLEQIDRKLRWKAWEQHFNTPYSPEIQT